MRRTIKFALLLVTLAVCVLGAVFSPPEVTPEHESKTHVVPVNNHQARRTIWLRV
jgi:hypothetical protein